jgi:hypothetical protein
MPPNTLETRRVHRWVFRTIGRGTGTFTQVELLVLKSASRPKFKFEEAKMDHDQETAYFAGKQTWEPIEMTWYDVEQNPDISAGIYAWLETVVNLSCAQCSHPATYKKQAILTVTNSFGAVSEEWTMYGTWPLDVDWKGLDYTSSEILTCVAKMRYDRAVRSCINNVKPIAVQPSCQLGYGAGSFSGSGTGGAAAGVAGGIAAGAGGGAGGAAAGIAGGIPGGISGGAIKAGV